MTFVTTSDGAQIFYKDWGPKEAPPLVFHHGWPLSADDWDAHPVCETQAGSLRHRSTLIPTAVQSLPAPRAARAAWPSPNSPRAGRFPCIQTAD